MKTANKGLTKTDRFGLFTGMVIFFLTLPLSLFAASIPALIVSNAVGNAVVALTLKLMIMGFAIVINFVMSTITGLALSYALGWAGRKLRLAEAIADYRDNRKPVEACKKTNLGALVGGSLAVAMFITKGAAPIASVTTRVEHLFPGSLVLSLGEAFSFNLSHVYAATTGFLAVGLLFAIIGIALGSLVAAAVELAFSH